MSFLPTKGVEYGLVLSYLALLIPFWKWFASRGAAARPLAGAAATRDAIAAWFATPEGYFFHRGHGWARPVDDRELEVGVDDFAYGLIGRPDALMLPRPGATLHQGEPGWSARIDGHRFDFLSPVDGEVVAINEAAVDRPALPCADPYRRGWLLRVRAANPTSQLRNLMPREVASGWMNSVERSLSARMGLPAQAVLQDGGLPISGFARQVGGDRWHELAEEFLLTR